jgi:predicted AlkP superfamily phosphohydrolase/phosphomutase
MGSKKLDSRARVNCVPNNDLNPALRVNLQGRDPHGNVAPGEDFERLLDLLERRLISLINPITGETAVRMVTRSSVTHPGANRDVLPDMTAMWKDDAWIGELYSPGFGTVAGNHRDLRTGGHDVDGFLAYRGPAEGLELESQIPDGKDVAPTVLDLLDVAIPRKMEGRSLFVRAAVGAQR